MGKLLKFMGESSSFANKVRTIGETGDVILHVISHGANGRLLADPQNPRSTV